MERLTFPITKRDAEKQGIEYSSKANKNALFPSQLRELREKKGVSQAVLARDLGVSKSTIGLYETGDTLPDARTLHDLAVYFEVSADYLLGLSHVPSTDTNIQKICEYTGLQEDIIRNLKRWKDSPINKEGSYFNFLNKFFSNDYFLLLLLNLYDFENAIEAKCVCEGFYQKLRLEEAGGRKYISDDDEADEIAKKTSIRYAKESVALSDDKKYSERVRELIVMRNYIMSDEDGNNPLKILFGSAELFEPNDLYKNRVIEYLNQILVSIEEQYDQDISQTNEIP